MSSNNNNNIIDIEDYDSEIQTNNSAIRNLT